MIDRLVECGGCSRHVKSCEAACPFCGAPLRAAPARVQATFRRTRAAAAVAAGVASVVACTTTEMQIYGAPDVPGDDDASFPMAEDAGGLVAPPTSGMVFYGSAGIEPPAGRDASNADASADASLDGATTDCSVTDAAADGTATDGAAVDGAATDGDVLDANLVRGG
jgi:hypothetical protein